MRSSLGVHFQWVVLATSRACGGAKGSVFKAQARARAGDANEMRSAVNPPSFPVRAPYAAMKVGTSWCGLGVHPNPTSGRKPFGRQVGAGAADLQRCPARVRNPNLTSGLRSMCAKGRRGPLIIWHENRRHSQPPAVSDEGSPSGRRPGPPDEVASTAAADSDETRAGTSSGRGLWSCASSAGGGHDGRATELRCAARLGLGRWTSTSSSGWTQRRWPV